MSIALGHMHHAYAQTDGTYKFPDSREGDILKQAKKELEELEAKVRQLRKIACYVPAKVYINAKESAGFGVTVTTAVIKGEGDGS